MITLSGRPFRWFAAAGAIGLAGCGEGLDPWRYLKRRWAYSTGKLKHRHLCFVTKTLTPQPRRGNFSRWRPWRSVRHGPPSGVMVNAVALTNPGLDVWLRDYYPLCASRRLNVVVSVAPSSVPEAVAMTDKIIIQAPLAIGIELNASCPNHDGIPDQVLKREIADAIIKRAHTILKLSADDDLALLGAAKPAALCLINAVPWQRALEHGMVSGSSPLAPYGRDGSVSGFPVAALARRTLSLSKELHPGVPVISLGGVLDAREARARFTLGADAVGFWTAFDVDPSLPNEIMYEVDSSRLV